ncbi:N-6 DNA methylase [Pedobacter sp. Leaf132]|uniref:Eco57I restriction-modification methylase domain-containing protein n=1 Tax=Pedobacter sp. Leaf132 TaxID=2876557 RepID=UPI001E2833B7|nr:N-6 DNA methylase [Pedobacter sp. Leaf132]
MDKKKSGSYYTPLRLAEAVANYCLLQLSAGERITVLEPSVGDGSFLSAISSSKNLERFGSVLITAVERNAEELDKAMALPLDPKIEAGGFNMDYLDYHFVEQQLFSLYIGNPPYVKKNLLDDKQKELASLIHAEKGLSNKSINNIWTSFLVSGLGKLDENGILALILPLELLQVKFTEEIRELLKQEFERIEIFTFDELQFQECKGQDTVLLIGYKTHDEAGTFYTNIQSLDELLEQRFEFYQNTALAEKHKKWTHHFISPEDYDFIEQLKIRLEPISHYVHNKPGVVTAANSFFIVNSDTIGQYNLKEFARPILQKGFFVNGSVDFTEQDFAALVAAKKPSYLLDFSNLEREDIAGELSDYIDMGVKLELPTRYKCAMRQPWYQIPNIADAPSAFFFKRAHEYPKLLSNDAQVLVTDSAYMIEMRNGFELNGFIFSFYNSLTLAFAELEGRYYGGGVLELTPNEFRVLPVPYVIPEDFGQYKQDFKNKKSIDELLERYNFSILNTSLGLTQLEIERIESIRKKLVNKRHRN